MSRRPNCPEPLILGLLATIALLSACGGAQPRVDERGWREDTAALIMAGAPDAPMAVLHDDDPAGLRVLRMKSTHINRSSPELTRLIQRMHATVLVEKGVGIAAPQVGVSRRVIVVQRFDKGEDKPFVAYINPWINDRSDETVVGWEGCLSIPAGMGKVRRHQGVSVRYDAVCTMAGVCTWPSRCPDDRVEGFTARIFQHEIDHLDGALFIDHRESGPLMSKEDYRAMRAREKAAGVPDERR